MPIVNKHPISGKREIICKSCGNFLVYNYSETVYVCEVCGKQYDPRNILSELHDQKKQKKNIVQTKVLPTKKQELQNEWAEIIAHFEQKGDHT